jgi:hypothetical protein
MLHLIAHHVPNWLRTIEPSDGGILSPVVIVVLPGKLSLMIRPVDSRTAASAYGKSVDWEIRAEYSQTKHISWRQERHGTLTNNYLVN